MAVLTVALTAFGFFGYKCVYNYTYDQIVLKAKNFGYEAKIDSFKFKYEGLEITNVDLKSITNSTKIHVSKINVDYEQTKLNISGVSVHAQTLGDILKNNNQRVKSQTGLGNSKNKRVVIRDLSITTNDFLTSNVRIVITDMGGLISIYTPDGFEYEKNGRKIIAKGVEIFPKLHALFKAKEIYITKVELPTKQEIGKSKEPIDRFKELLREISNFDLTFEFEKGSIKEGFVDASFEKARGQIIKSNNAVELTFDSNQLAQSDLITLENPKIKVNITDDIDFILDMKGDSAITKNDAIVNNTIKSKEFSVYLEGSIDSALYANFSGKFTIGKISVNGSFSMSQNLLWDLQTPELQCEDIINYLPRSVISKLSEAKYGGSIKLMVRGELKNNEPSITLKVRNECKVISLPDEFSVKKFESKFVHHIYDPKGQMQTMETGPGSGNWTDISDISEHMISAVINSEDPGFYGHSGISYAALQSAMEDNIRQKSFFRGASTISMQLAKNLWLMREKTIARKIQEAFLVIQLEQALTKKQIMELYLNVIEYGPNIYGIKKAAEYYFHAKPYDLSLAQCVFLASILPSPKTNYFNSDGELGERRTQYIEKLLLLMAERSMITDEELKSALEESVVFGISNIKTKVAKVAEDGMPPSEWN